AARGALRPRQRASGAAQELHPAWGRRGLVTPPRRAHGLPAGRTGGGGAGRGGGREPGGPCVSQPSLGSALHPRARRVGRRRAALEAWELLLAGAASFATAFIGGAIGLVLGSLRLPALLVAATSPAAAAGTNIAVSASAALTAGATHARAGRVDWRIAAWMTPPSVAAAFV